MTQLTNGFRSALSNPVIYEWFQRLMGATHMRTEFVREFIRPEAGMRILDVGCGTAEILAFLPSNVEYSGFDISQKYVDTARRRFSARGEFTCGVLNANSLSATSRFDVLMALGVLHHLDDDEVIDTFNLARIALVPGGRVLTIDPCLVKPQDPVASFLIKRDRGRNVRGPAEYRMLAEGRFSRVDGVVRHRAWIPYTHWIMECRL